MSGAGQDTKNKYSLTPNSMLRGAAAERRAIRTIRPTLIAGAAACVLPSGLVRVMIYG